MSLSSAMDRLGISDGPGLARQNAYKKKQLAHAQADEQAEVFRGMSYAEQCAWCRSLTEKPGLSCSDAMRSDELVQVAVHDEHTWPFHRTTAFLDIWSGTYYGWAHERV